jgi:hypothetical protein
MARFLQTVALVVAVAASAYADVIVLEPFNYDDGALDGRDGGYEGIGAWTGPWDGDSGPQVVSLQMKAKNTSMHRTFSGVSDGSTVYVGVTLGMPSDDNSIFSVELNDPDNTGVGGFNVQGFGERDGQRTLNGNKVGPNGPFPMLLRMVLRVDLNFSGTQDRMTLWDDDYSDDSFDLTEASPHRSQATLDVFAGTLTTIGFQGQALGPTITIDDLIVATTFDEAAAGTIPEPATLVLMGLGSLALRTLRRRSA